MNLPAVIATGAMHADEPIGAAVTAGIFESK